MRVFVSDTLAVLHAMIEHLVSRHDGGDSMRRSVGSCCIALVLVAGRAAGQVTRIHKATPAAVTAALQATLQPQGFKAGKTDDKGALFALDKGESTVNTAQGMVVYRVTIELQSHYKQRGDSLEVSLKEEVVRTSRDSEDRTQVVSRNEVDNLQRLLDGIRTDLETKARADSSAH